MIACIRTNSLPADRANDYRQQIEHNQKYLRKSVLASPLLPFSRLIVTRWFSPSPVNAGTWVTLVVRDHELLLMCS